MRSKVLVAGVLVALVLSAVVLGGVLTERWWLAAIGGWAFLAATFLLALDADRRVRRQDFVVRKLIAKSQAAAHARQQAAAVPVAPPAPPPVSEADVLGTVRLLQAQYVGRLDRLQTTVDQAVEKLDGSSSDASEVR